MKETAVEKLPFFFNGCVVFFRLVRYNFNVCKIAPAGGSHKGAFQ